MNERSQFHALNAIAAGVMALSVLVAGIGLALFSRLGKMSVGLPVDSVDQFRNVSGLMPLISELSDGIGAARDSGRELAWKTLDFSVNKLAVATRLAEEGFQGKPHNTFAYILDEIESICGELRRRVDARAGLGAAEAALIQTRVDYVYDELRDYVFRVNNDTLTALEASRDDIRRLKRVLLWSSLVALAAAALSASMIASRIRLFAQLRASRELAESHSRAKSEFLSNMSHEIRTPMNAIIGLCYLALKSGLNPAQRDYLLRIQSSGNHLLGIISDILDFSKIEAGKLSVESVPFELEKVLDNVGTLISERAGAKGLELVFDVAPDVPDRLVGDPLRLGQILINFASNAVKFTERGEIAVRVRLLSESGTSVKLRFEVEDTGLGIAPELQGKLFQSFQQADSSVTRKFGGTGLGLAISKGLAAMMGGETGFDSEPGRGSTFWFTAALGKGEEARRALVPRPDARGKRVLVVDDNEHARSAMCDMLSRMSLVATSVPSGRAAIEELEAAESAGFPYDIALIDWQMPEMDGIEAARRIGGGRLKAKPMLAMVTAYGREEAIKEAEAAGFLAVLIKPVSQSLLFDTVMQLLCRGQKSACADPADVTEAADRPVDAELGGMRVLLVEDNELNQAVATEILAYSGCEVVVAANGAEAVSKVEGGIFDVVLMDMQMPVMDGVEATLAIRSTGRHVSLPIIAMTANAMPEDRDRCIGAGMNGFVAKPMDPERLVDLLKRYLPRDPDARNGAKRAGSKAGPESEPEAQEAPGEPDPRPTREPAADQASGAGGPAGAALTARPAVAARASRIPGIPGVDVDGGLRRVMGNEALYLELLGRFVSGQSDAAARFEDALGRGERAEAARVAHTLKGVAGNIGITELQEAADRLENAVGSGADAEELGPLIGDLAGRLGSARASILAALDGAAPAVGEGAGNGAGAKGPGRPIRAILEELIGLAAASDSEAIDRFAEAKDSLRASCGESEVGGLDRALGAYDFQAALRILERLRSTLLGGENAG